MDPEFAVIGGLYNKRFLTKRKTLFTVLLLGTFFIKQDLWHDDSEKLRFIMHNLSAQADCGQTPVWPVWINLWL